MYNPPSFGPRCEKMIDHTLEELIDHTIDEPIKDSKITIWTKGGLLKAIGRHINGDDIELENIELIATLGFNGAIKKTGIKCYANSSIYQEMMFLSDLQESKEFIEKLEIFLKGYVRFYGVYNLHKTTRKNHVAKLMALFLKEEKEEKNVEKEITEDSNAEISNKKIFNNTKMRKTKSYGCLKWIGPNKHNRYGMSSQIIQGLTTIWELL
jgi:hypothetical protein